MTSTDSDLLPGRPEPERRPIRSWQDAELNAAAWLRHWGFGDAVAQPGGSAEGTTLHATGAIGRVQRKAVSVGRPDLQKLVAARGPSTDSQLFFFTGSDYAMGAVEYAEYEGIALFVYDLDGSMTPASGPAASISEEIPAAVSDEIPAAPPAAPAVSIALDTKNSGPNWPFLVATILLVAPCAAIKSDTLYPGPGWLNLLKLVGLTVLGLLAGLMVVGMATKGAKQGDSARKDSGAGLDHAAVSPRAGDPGGTSQPLADEPRGQETGDAHEEPGSPSQASDRTQLAEHAQQSSIVVEGRETMTEMLRDDPRTAWAYRRYVAQRAPGPIGADLGREILAAIESGDHIELITDAVVEEETGLFDAINRVRTGTAPFIAVRTMRSWIFVARSTGLTTVIPGQVWDGSCAFTSAGTTWPNIGWATDLETTDGRCLTVKIFFDTRDCVERKILENGAGGHILRLPEAPAVPPIPDLESLPTEVPAAPSGFLPTDWQTAEEIARAHMRSLGFVDAEATAGGRDGGIDVVARDGVAQVKMHALPIGAPPVQQLRGARPHIAHHLFYSTSGYTSAAVAAASETGVFLFKIGRDGSVSAVNEHAATLARDGLPADEAQADTARTVSAKQVVTQYGEAVAERIIRAVNATDHGKAHEREKFEGQYRRAAGYLKQALDNLDNRPSSFTSYKSALVFYHHTELLAHVWFQELGIPYPDGAKDTGADSLDSYYD